MVLTSIYEGLPNVILEALTLNKFVADRLKHYLRYRLIFSKWLRKVQSNNDLNFAMQPNSVKEYLSLITGDSHDGANKKDLELYAYFYFLKIILSPN